MVRLGALVREYYSGRMLSFISTPAPEENCAVVVAMMIENLSQRKNLTEENLTRHSRANRRRGPICQRGVPI
jgi:hypothetical protein